MPQCDLRKTRNIGIISHIDAGKTTVTERILFYTGGIHRLGEVHEGLATTDWMPQERGRGISITAAAVTILWKDYLVTILDTPGHVDFTIEVERSLRILDGVIAIFSAVEGVEPQSETVWYQADRYRIPRIAFINKLDRIGAEFTHVLQEIREKLGAEPLCLQLPIGAEQGFRGVVDLIEERALTWSSEDQGKAVLITDIPGELEKTSQEARERLLESIAELDETFLAAYLGGEGSSPDAIRAALRRITLANRGVPVLMGSGLRNQGVQPLLDAVVDLLPSPLDLPPTQGIDPRTGDPAERPHDPKAPLSALAFKIITDEGRRLTYLRIYSGQIKPGTSVFNANQAVEERAARIFRMFSNKRERLEVAGPGSIIAVTGLKATYTGDTLCPRDSPIQFESLQVPTPVMDIALEAQSSAEEKKLNESLEKLMAEDPTFRVRVDEETGQTLLSGMGELHLDVLVRRLIEEFGLKVKVGKPQVVYRETIAQAAEAEGVFEHEVSGKIQFAQAVVRVEPLPRGAGLKSGVRLSEAEIPAEFWPALEQSMTLQAQSGPLRGYQVVDLLAQVVGGSYNESKSTELAYEVAAAKAFQAALGRARPVLLEPLMRVEIVVPEDFLGAVINDLNARRGKVEAIVDRGKVKLVKASAPLSRLFGYSTDLRSATQGRATYSMQFSRYDVALEPAPSPGA